MRESERERTRKKMELTVAALLKIESNSCIPVGFTSVMLTLEETAGREAAETTGDAKRRSIEMEVL